MILYNENTKGNTILHPYATPLLPALLRDRHPVAVAAIQNEDASLTGAIRFFRTPLGTIVSAELHGTIHAPHFDLLLHKRHRSETIPLPLLKAGESSAFLACITQRFTIEDVLGTTVEIRTDVSPCDYRAKGQVSFMPQTVNFSERT